MTAPAQLRAHLQPMTITVLIRHLRHPPLRHPPLRHPPPRPHPSRQPHHRDPAGVAGSGSPPPAARPPRSPSSTRLSPRSSPRSILPWSRCTASPPTSPGNYWSPPGTTRSGCTPRPRSPCSAASHRCPHRRARTDRHRLNRGGDRHANAALYRVVLLPTALGPPHPRLRRTPHRPRPVQTRDHPLPQALHRPRDLHRPDPPPPTSQGAHTSDLTSIGASRTAGPPGPRSGSSAAAPRTPCRKHPRTRIEQRAAAN